ncbi:DNA topoisomerase VI subunit B [Candidatus Woesearchaeota archaeon]|nr:DNA topoisomerase VI subunit B [Candidatus Woesearchaeota archaeon]
MDNNRVHAKELAKKQKEISVAEFFEKNRHLLGFDNPRKALLTTIKEAVDNSLDATEEARILPEISVEIVQLSENRFKITIEDNGPGIIKAQLPKIFAKLLYGSKFHKLSQSRGQQGIGISAAVLYAQLTTGKPALVQSKTDRNKKANQFALKINTQTNEPQILEEGQLDWPEKEHGTRIEMELEGSYFKGKQSVDEYLKETAITNPHATFIYTNPLAEQIIFARVVNELPIEPKEIKPHPYGVELGMLIKMMQNTSARTLQSFLMQDFSRVGPNTAKELCQNAKLLPKVKPKNISRDMAEQLHRGIQETKIISPPTNCLSPIGAELLEKGLRKEINAEFYTSVTRPPSVYRGNPFLIEVGLAYGGEQEKDKAVRLLRYANRVPLIYQPGACAVTQAVQQIAWNPYGLSQSKRSLPVGPLTLVVHIASVWVPFTSESKEAIAHYPEIMKEMKLAVRECGRKLGIFVNKTIKIHAESQKRSYIETYIPYISEALKELIDIKDTAKVEKLLHQILEKQRGTLEKIEINNPDYDPELAKIGQEEKPKKPTKQETQTKLT